MFADRLKKSLLQAAIQGQLTEQLPTDGDARDLLRKIRAEKTKLIADKKIKAENSLPPVTNDEIPFDIPDNWCWVHLGEVCSLMQYGTSKKSQLQGRIPVLRMGNLQNGKIDYSSLVYSSDEGDIEAYSLDFNDILFNRTNSAELVGKTSIYKGERKAIFAGYLVRLKTVLINNDFLNIVMQSPYYKEFCYSVMGRGVSQANISAEKLKIFLLPLPPLAEQKRIVEKLDVLLSEVDKLAKDERELTELEETFPRRMRNSLLQAAIQGKLTEQLPSDGNARDLLKKIRAEKAKLVAEKKIKAEKPLPPISDNEIPFDLPDNWCWCRLNEVIYSVGSKANQILSKEVQKTGKYPAVSQGQQFIDGYTNSDDKLIYDVPLIMFGDHTRNVKYVDFPFVISADGTKFFKPILVEPRYFYWWLVLTASLLHNRGYNRHYRLLKLELFPLPPIAEQKRIVEQLEELLPLC